MSTTDHPGPVTEAITVSLEGCTTGPDDRAGQGLGVGGERLHHRVTGGRWTYGTDRGPGAGTTDAAARGDDRRPVRVGRVRQHRSG